MQRHAPCHHKVWGERFQPKGRFEQSAWLSGWNSIRTSRLRRSKASTCAPLAQFHRRPNIPDYGDTAAHNPQAGHLAEGMVLLTRSSIHVVDGGERSHMRTRL